MSDFCRFLPQNSGFLKDMDVGDSLQISKAERVEFSEAGSSRFYAVLLVSSIAIHLVAYWFLFMTSLPRGRRALPIKSIGVEFITGRQLDQLFAKPVVEDIPTASISGPIVPQVEPKQLPSPVPPIETDQAPQRVVARKFQLGRILAEPENKELLDSLVLFDPADQREQLCNLEVMEQIQIWNADYKPERVVAFAYGDVRISHKTITADGAAFRSASNWYRLQYTCTFEPTNNQVTAMDFFAGDQIPQSDWEDHFLFAE
ncbi:DUF930 domain-containing protein [Pseudovibrio sp. Tun.PSC04-5.I4]|uniref:DUF930 domain-containing protein n=1 Tax=Pseudovibrio sp. Tun.PSC04-5.I4 TaxID=1798213 RepID=UPI00088292D3|nr:DUF930 domain-containing protein [Pseudovibrio sp. Tun.PSC04-5.I4]SDR48277.1 protein of unknown function [Pseudovibrio sp. Tun.PSC04-5.I4]